MALDLEKVERLMTPGLAHYVYAYCAVVIQTYVLAAVFQVQDKYLVAVPMQSLSSMRHHLVDCC
jgi:hypothetical protein